ncbi:MAG: DUF4878 domain-containing protein [Neisseriaceae bacterium]|nr:DUF4878 domain-containing protein [Neisseriaceae bacterium]
MRTLWHKISLFLSMLFMAFALSACGGSGPAKVAEKFERAAYAGDIDTVMSVIYFDDNDKKNGTEDMMRGKLSMMLVELKKQSDAKGGVKNIKTEKAQYNSDKTRATVNVTVTFKDKTEVTEDLSLMKTKKGWKVKL